MAAMVTPRPLEVRIPMAVITSALPPATAVPASPAEDREAARRVPVQSARLPRYTSYPTALQFSGAVGPDQAAAWMRSVAGHDPVSIYIHVPFCDTLCWFCGCHTRVINTRGPIVAFVHSLIAEIEMVGALLGRRHPVRHLHFGGGSPTILEPEDIDRIFQTLARSFDIGADAEIALEIDPRDVDPARLDAWATAGVNRASLGVQDLDPVVQKAINRIQPAEATARAVAMLRERGINAINIDLVHGLPHQTTDGVLATLDQVLTLTPDRVALFGYAHVPSMKQHQRLIPDAALPGPAARLEQADAAARRLKAAGYVGIGLDHFARAHDPLAVAQRQGLLRRNFQGYTTDTAAAIIGFGPSAIGDLPGGYVQNTIDVRAWREAVAEGRLATIRGVAVDDDDRLRRAVIERLMCDHGVDVAAVAASMGRDPEVLAGAMALIDPLEERGIVLRDGWRLLVPVEMTPDIQRVAACFDAYLNPAVRQLIAAE